MADPYATVLKKYGKTGETTILKTTDTSPKLSGPLPKPTIVPVVPGAPSVSVPIKETAPVSSDPYANVVKKYAKVPSADGGSRPAAGSLAEQKKIAQLASDAQAAENNGLPGQSDGIVKSVVDVAKDVPGAFGSIVKEFATHPIKSGQSAILGAMDAGVSAVNVGSAVMEFLQKKIGTSLPFPGLASRGRLELPSLSQTFHDYVGSSEEQRAISEGAKQGAAYELGGAGVRGIVSPKTLKIAEGAATRGPLAGVEITSGKMAAQIPTTFAKKAVTTIAGNVVGGQLIIPEDTPFGERAKQAAFDAAFGAAQVGAGKILSAARGAKGTKIEPPKTEVPPGENPPPAGPAASAAEKPSQIGRAVAPPAPKISDVVYVKKTNLGNDTSGEPVLATTQYDSKTGRAIVYYKGSLEKNPTLLQTVLDHEEGHVLDKRVNAGKNLSAEISNPSGNSANLRNVLGPFARQIGMPVQEAAEKLAADIEKLSKSTGSSPGERFANAYAAFRADPKFSRETAPVFAKFMDHQPVPKEPKIQERSITAKALKPEKPAPESISARKAKVAQRQTTEKAPETRKIGRRTTGTPGKVPGKATAFPNRKKPISIPEKTTRQIKRVSAPEQKKATVGKETYEISRTGKKRTWVRAEAVAATKQFAKAVEKHGYTQEVVGGVAKFGRSSHDLDVLITPKKGTHASGESILKVVDEVRKKYPIAQIDDDIIGFQTPEGKTFEIFLGNVPERVWSSEKFVTEIGSRISADAPFFKGKPIAREIEVPQTRRIAPPNLKAKPTPGTGRIAGTGLRTGKGVQTKSFNPKTINAPTEVQELFDKMGSENKNFAGQRLSKGNDDLRDLARLTGLTEEELLAAKPGSIANSETVTAARQLVIDKATKLMNTLKSIDVSVASPTELKQIRDDFVKLVSMQKAVAGFRTEASNVFRSLGLELIPGENATLSELAQLLKNAGVAAEGDVAIFANKVAKESTLKGFAKFREGALSTWYAAILSGPKTTARNVLSTSSNILTEIVAKAANPRQWREVMPAISGLIRGLRMGVGEARDVLGGSPYTSKFMEPGSSATRPEVFTGKFATYGKIVESVGRWLAAQDKLLSAGAREMERASLKARGSEVSKAVEEAIVKAYSERTVYHGQPTGPLIQGIRNAAQTLRAKVPGSKFIIPFVDTVANVMDRQFDYFPITAALRLKGKIISDQASRIMKEYGLKEADRAFIEQRLRDQQVGRLVLGSVVSTGAIMLASGGRVSGNGPTNYAKKQELIRTGWRPNSIKIGDVWVPYTYLGPLAGILSMAGNVHDKVTYDDAPNKSIVSLIGNGLIGWTQTQLDQSFLSGVSDLFDVATGNINPETYLVNLGAGLVPIPALYSQTKDMVFRQQYQTHGIVEKLRLKLGLTGDVFGMDPLQQKFDVFGEPMRSDLIYGLTPKAEQMTPVDNFLIANDLAISIPSYSQQYSIPGTQKEKRKLTDEEYTQYIKETGQQIYEQLSHRMAGIAQLPADKQKTEVQSLVDGIRTRVRAKIMRAGSK